MRDGRLDQMAVRFTGAGRRVRPERHGENRVGDHLYRINGRFCVIIEDEGASECIWAYVTFGIM